MAVGTVLLPIPTAVMPGVEADDEGLEFAIFGDAAEEVMRWRFVMPTEYGGNPVLTVLSMMKNGITGGVVVGGRMAATTPDNSENFGGGSYSTQVKARTAVPGTASHVFSTTLSLNDDTAAPKDQITLEMSRVGDDITTGGTGDDATNDLRVLAVRFEYDII